MRAHCLMKLNDGLDIRCNKYTVYYKHFCFVKFKCYLIIKLCLVVRLTPKISVYVCECKCMHGDTFTASRYIFFLMRLIGVNYAP